MVWREGQQQQKPPHPQLLDCFLAPAAICIRILSHPVAVARRPAADQTTTTNRPGPNKQTQAAEAAAAKAQAATAGQRAAQQQCRAQTDRRTDTAKGNSGRTGAAEGKTKTPAQQTTVQE
jgi:hypothetical protein